MRTRTAWCYHHACCLLLGLHDEYHAGRQKKWKHLRPTHPHCSALLTSESKESTVPAQSSLVVHFIFRLWSYPTIRASRQIYTLTSSRRSRGGRGRRRKFKSFCIPIREALSRRHWCTTQGCLVVEKRRAYILRHGEKGIMVSSQALDAYYLCALSYSASP